MTTPCHALNTISSFIPLVLAHHLLWICRLLFKVLQPGLRHIPEPWLAKFTPLWRIWFVWDGSAHVGYRRLHERYGPIVRTAPNVVNISDPAAINTIFGIGSRFTKSLFYTPFTVRYDGEVMDNILSTNDFDEHKRLKRSVAPKYSMTSMRSLEYLVDPCTKIFIDAMMDLQGQVVDLGAWVQWCAFDVMGAERKDVRNVIAGLEMGAMYMSVVGQMPWLHNYLLGNFTVGKVLAKITGGKGDLLPVVIQMVLDSISQDDAESAGKPARADFLSFFLHLQENSMEEMSHRDMVNHLMDNLIGIALRSVFYYLMKNKHAYQILQKEIGEAHARGKLSPYITYTESLRLDYLKSLTRLASRQACLKEAMRMDPIISFPLERVVPSGGVALCGAQILAGTIVGINAAVIHRDTDIFGLDANEFRPKRWLDKEDEARIKRIDRHLMTFGIGDRTCIGKNLSNMEMGKFVPQVLRQFD
ncbi:cytochrome P450 [Lentithecium fluviatile CBS 122367]|uniref:Cytochrome P450 n=1 Tax=Lentithecium fluviatile CBS 122367 TaxID=1168545 RepID=A0A6G1IYP3_9PLEO|nr:cytochrome P450 [Lentithecium fluviatile CBS 122367]